MPSNEYLRHPSVPLCLCGEYQWPERGAYGDVVVAAALLAIATAYFFPR